jgi:hypothetical protein
MIVYRPHTVNRKIFGQKKDGICDITKCHSFRILRSREIRDLYRSTKTLTTVKYESNSKSNVPYFIRAERIPALSCQAWVQLVHIFTTRWQ